MPDALFRIPELDRRVLILAYYRRMPLTDVAALVGGDVPAVLDCLHRAAHAIVSAERPRVDAP
ncbi:hypothetical protein FOS14_02800 [Skermania sp. ID1734]|nr:hypothetical protein FOS14_02800 [Skermania sp. ID1734]